MSRRKPSEAVHPAMIAVVARDYIGTPFRHQGRSKTGIDCIGLCVMALRGAGLRIKDRNDYGRRPDLSMFKAELDGQLIRLPKGTPLATGLIALFHDPLWLHVGVATGPASVIHSRGPEEIGDGVMEHRVDDQSWGPRLLRLWRHEGMIWDG